MEEQTLKWILQGVGLLLGLLYLWLEYRVSPWLWLIGIIMPVVHGVLYYRSGLYADAGMEVYYVLAGAYGWFVWRHRSAHQPDRMQISHIPGRIVCVLMLVYVLLHAGLYLFLSRCTDSTVPFMDAMTTALSMLALWMLSRKYIEQWLVWLLVDALTVGLYGYKGIPLTAGLYALYTVLAVVGYLKWRREIPHTSESA